MLRIMRLQMAPGRATLRLEGRVIGPWVDELERSCEQVLAGGHALTLDVADVAFVEPRGARLLKALLARGVAVENCPAFVSEQLKALSPC